MAESSEIGIAQLGLASILKHNQLRVPPNQREYSWTEKEVQTLLHDFAKAITGSDKGNYFVGTIVTVPKEGGILEVVDGQQRLATTAIILCAIRDYVRPTEKLIAQSIDSEFLNVIDRTRRESIPRLTLNLDDNDFFKARLSGANEPQPTKLSHELIDGAFSEARQYVKKIVSGYNKKDHGDILNGWLGFLENRAVAVLLKVPRDADAYRMFETLNDRGLRTSQSDLVKNYLLGRSGDRTAEVQQKWAFMRGALEAVNDDDITIVFLRHALTIISGFVREADVYEAVQTHAKGSQPIVTFANQLETLANTYAAIFNPENERWNGYSHATRQAIEVLNLFNIHPIRPLMLATAQSVPKKEAEKIFQFLVSLGLRLMLTNGTRTGSVEEGIAAAAHKVYAEEIDSLASLKGELKKLTPSDEAFQVEFENASLTNQRLARYILRSLEMAAKKERDPWHIPNDDKGAINLEHVLPERPEENWPKFTADEVKLYWKRIGNLTLLRAKDNSHMKNASFSTKKPNFASAPYELTRQIAEATNWTKTEIIERQKTLAELAVKAWAI